ncbi:MAG TPA: TIGR03067 domain-containing protein [Gemmataceae bacterium]|nr:TIGR03067 domain-containing protein [Gemmataceae bacterium]
MRSILALVLLSVPAALVADDKKPADADAKAMVGKYGVMKAELGGKDLTEPLKVLKFEITEGGKYTASHGEEIDAGTFTLDPTKTPKTMDVKPTGGPLKGKLVKAIYKLDGDILTICYDHNAGDRPTAFESKPDTTTLLVAYKRAK